MGFNRRFRSLHDADRYQADFALICPRCGYQVLFERQTLIAILRAKQVNPDVAVAGARLRCTACGKRGCIIELAPEGTAEALKLRDGDSLPLPGLSISQWCAGWTRPSASGCGVPPAGSTRMVGIRSTERFVQQALLPKVICLKQAPHLGEAGARDDPVAVARMPVAAPLGDRSDVLDHVLVTAVAQGIVAVG